MKVWVIVDRDGELAESRFWKCEILAQESIKYGIVLFDHKNLSVKQMELTDPKESKG